MRTPLPSPVKSFAVIAVLVVLAGCLPGPNTRPVPSVAQIGSNLKCSTGDHGFEDTQAGWGFCYPGTWKYEERSQGSTSPPGLDLTFDITDIPCTSPTGASARPVCSPNAGLFAFMIISTYERGSSPNLAAWELANLAAVPASDTISWGDAVEAARFSDGRRIALTTHHVVIMDLHSGEGHLDLETQMSGRLNTWKFSY
ncbi:MAG TPA: hypothetical protein VN965_10495 [Candidatus Dormibacteraeota bacterium]|nr:hypothetical protein [Candidatus Dormibacteraeota bacterium]